MRDRLTTDGVRVTSRTAAKSSVRELDGAPPYDKTKVSHIVSVLTQVSAAMDYTKKALEELTSVPSDEISPDGNLGGRGNVMSVRDMKTEMSEALVSLSTLRDTLSDELNNPGWGLSKDEKDSITRIQEKSEESSQDVMEDITTELEQIFGVDEVPAEDDSTDAGEIPESDEEGFPSFEDAGEEENAEVADSAPKKEASSSNTPFIGLNSRADGVTRKLASAVLKGLVKSCTESTKQVGEIQ